MKLEEKKRKLMSLQECIIERLKGYTFDELKEMLGVNTEAIIRGCILDAMEKYYKKDYDKWIEEA